MPERLSEPPPAQPREPYSPHLKTALVLTGTGTAGAYHAGVLRALHEAGVKVDLVAGRGIGVAGAVFAAIDGAARLWETDGVWRSPAVARFYGWCPVFRLVAWTLVATLAVLLVPMVALAVGLLAYGFAFLLYLIGLNGAGLAAGYVRLIEAAFQPAALPTILPRVVVLVLGAALVLALLLGLASARRGVTQRRTRGQVWWHVLGAPLETKASIEHFERSLWHLIRGPARLRRPTRVELSRRYAELLAENQGQPGFRELLVIAHDLDARGDLVFALLAEPGRRDFFWRRLGAGERRSASAFDLAGVGRDHVLDALAAALSLPVATEPHQITFARESYWRGETHRLYDRPAALARLLEELLAAGTQQVILASPASGDDGPHTLSARRADGRGRVGEYLASVEGAVLRDVMAAHAGRFKRVFQIRPAHNPIGPFDFGGCYDERSDRWQGLGELLDRGYEDAYRQFIEPVVGASGERLQAATPRR